MLNSLRRVTDSEIRLLGVFHKVVACGGLSAAELELNIGRSTISRHLKDLEIRLGVKLCHRGRSRFSLTTEGKEVYEASLSLFSALSDFKTAVNSIQENIKGVLSIGLFDKVTGNPQCNMHRAIEQFCHRYPDIKIEVHVDPLNEIENKVIQGEYHLGVVPVHRSSACLEYTKLFNENMYLYCGEGHRLFQVKGEIEAAGIKNDSFACMGFNSPNMEICNSFGLRQAATAYNQEGIAMLIQSGMFLGFLPDHYAESFIRTGKMCKVNCDKYSYECEFSVIRALAIEPERPAEEFIKALTAVHL